MVSEEEGRWPIDPLPTPCLRVTVYAHAFLKKSYDAVGKEKKETLRTILRYSTSDSIK